MVHEFFSPQEMQNINHYFIHNSFIRRGLISTCGWLPGRSVSPIPLKILVLLTQNQDHLMDHTDVGTPEQLDLTPSYGVWQDSDLQQSLTRNFFQA